MHIYYCNDSQYDKFITYTIYDHYNYIYIIFITSIYIWYTYVAAPSIRSASARTVMRFATTRHQPERADADVAIQTTHRLSSLVGQSDLVATSPAKPVCKSESQITWLWSPTWKKYGDGMCGFSRSCGVPMYFFVFFCEIQVNSKINFVGLTCVTQWSRAP